ncbi:MAG: NnrU family protein [Betaproteobacteria bacterium]
MTGNLAALFAAMLAFVGGHFLLSSPPVRGALVALIGETAFAAMYSLIMLACLAWVIAAYRVAPPHVLWDAGFRSNLVPLIAMPFAMILAVVGLGSRSPTLMGGGALFRHGAVEVRGVFTITRHPFLCGAALWAIAHLVANGDAASVLLFGGMAILAIAGMFAIDHKRSLKLGDAWASYVGHSSRFPFAAAVAGRTRVDWAGIGWLRPALGVVLYVVLLFAHDWLFGVPAGLILN